MLVADVPVVADVHSEEDTEAADIANADADTWYALALALALVA